MKPPRFELVSPRTLDEALAALAGYEGDAKVLAGGQSLVPAMNFRLAAPAALVDLNGIAGHDQVRRDGNELSIGMLVRHAALEKPAVDDALGHLLARTARLVGHLPIRVRGTVAGSLAHADPAAEWCMVAAALEARVVVRRAGGARTISAGDLFEGPFTTALQADEIITEVRLPLLGGAGVGVVEETRTAGDFAIVAATGVVAIDQGVVVRAHVGIAGVEGHPRRLRSAEAALVGAAPEPRALERAARLAAEEVDPVSDAVASSDYRRHLVEVLVRRAVEQACVGARS